MRALRLIALVALVLSGAPASAQPGAPAGIPPAGSAVTQTPSPGTIPPVVSPADKGAAGAHGPDGATPADNPGSAGTAAIPEVGSAGSASAGSAAGSGSAAKPGIVAIDCATVPADTLVLKTTDGKYDPPILVVPTGNAVRIQMTSDDVEPYPNSKETALVAPAGKTTCLRFDKTGEYKFHAGGHPLEGEIIAKPWYDILADRQPIQGGNFWMPESVNSESNDSDMMFYSCLGLSAFFFFAIAASVIYLTVKYRHRPGHKSEPSPAHNDALEITWTIIPTIICVFLFYYGWRAYVKVVTPPTKAVEIQVVAKRWAWNFTHSNGVTDSDLHLPVNTPVRFVMTSTDVLHSFYIPVMRIKQDLVPRRYTYAWLNATKPGTYRLNCAEYCGTDHSQMGHTGPILPDWPQGRRAVVVVHEPGGYEKYLSDKQTDDNSGDPVGIGRKMFEKKGCNACHTIDGTAKIGPTWKHPDWGKMIPLADGTSVKMDENYVRESILSPGAKIHQGFANQMPSFEGQLKPSELDGLIAFIKSLKEGK